MENFRPQTPNAHDDPPKKLKIKGDLKIDGDHMVLQLSRSPNMPGSASKGVGVNFPQTSKSHQHSKSVLAKPGFATGGRGTPQGPRGPMYGLTPTIIGMSSPTASPGPTPVQERNRSSRVNLGANHPTTFDTGASVAGL